MNIQKNLPIKIWEIIIRKRMLRILALLNTIFIIFIIIFLGVNHSYSKKIEFNQKLISQNEQDLKSLQSLVLNSSGQIDLNMFQNKSFADYNEVIPFIALLENMFSKVDPQASITIRSQDNDIFVNHYADYKISLNLKDRKILDKPLKELYDSRFITKILDFSINYPVDTKISNIGLFEFTIRLFLK